MKTFFATLCTLVLAWIADAQTVISTQSALPPPPDGQYQSMMNFLPANGDVVTLNPPQFQWLYSTNFPALYTDPIAKTFVFEIATDNLFANVQVNVTTPWNFYNTLAPLTPGNMYYWRIGYVQGINNTGGVISPASTNGAIYFWSSTNSFSVAMSALTWDRSGMADMAYVASKAFHPYTVFNPGNRAAVKSWLDARLADFNAGTTNLVYSDAGKAWRTISNNAVAIMADPSWPASFPVGGPSQGWAIEVLDVAFMWGITRSATWSNGLDMELSLMATNFVTNGNYAADYVGNSLGIAESDALAFGYDWVSNLFNFTEQTNVLNSLGLRCSWTLHNQQFGDCWMVSSNLSFGAGDLTGLYSGGIKRPVGTGIGSFADLGASHGNDNFYIAMRCALAGYNENVWCSNLFQMGVNYMMGPAYIFRRELGNGRSYTPVHIGQSRQELTFPQFQLTFPEVGWTNNPYFNQMLDFMARLEPVGGWEYEEPWTDAGGGFASFTDWEQSDFLPLVLMSQNTNYLAEWWNAETWFKGQNHNAFLAGPASVALPFFLYTNTVPLGSVTNLTKIFTNEGWFFTATKPPSDVTGFSNGVTLMMQARPTGCEGGHTTFSDGSFQIMAYGASVTDAGEVGIQAVSHLPWQQYSLMINGLGQEQPIGIQVYPQYGYFNAFTNFGTNFSYAAMDLTECYGRTNFAPYASGTTLFPQFTALNGVGSLSYLSSVTRQVLFRNNLYFVIFDTITCTNLPTNYISFLYRIPYSSTLALNTSSNFNFSYVTTNWMNAAKVTNYVAFANAAGELTVSNMVGTNIAAGNYLDNPYTVENYAGGSTPAAGNPWIANLLWFNNATPANLFHFLTVIYPVTAGMAPPNIVRLDDYTTSVNGDVVSFETSPPQTAALSVGALGLFPNVSVIVNMRHIP